MFLIHRTIDYTTVTGIRRHKTLEVVRRDGIVGIDKDYALAAGIVKSEIACRAHSAIGYIEQTYSIVSKGITAAYFIASVTATVIYQQQFKVRECLRKNALKTLIKPFFGIIDGHDNGNIHSSSNYRR